MSQDEHTAKPIRYDPAFEILEEDEAETAQGIVDQMRKILEITAKDYGHSVRSVHAKSHAILSGELEVYGNLPEAYAQGIFREGARYDAVLRFSTNPGDILDDSISVPRGLALKIIGVEGERLEGSEGANTQDFVMINGPAFSAPTAKAFLSSLKLLAATTDTPQVLKKVASAALRGAETLAEAAGGESPTLLSLGGHPNTHPLGDTFHTQVPLLYGPYMAKLSVAPVSANLLEHSGEKVATRGRPDALREELNEHFTGGGGEWELRVQLLTDPETMPLEDSSVVWPEDKSPHVAVARLRVSPQAAWNEARSKAVDDAMAFSPWHGIAEHRPLGSVMRVRKPAYEMSGEFRARFNRCPIHEPASAADTGLPD
ncbi:MAG: catalase family protein [Methylobacterium sp.]